MLSQWSHNSKLLRQIFPRKIKEDRGESDQLGEHTADVVTDCGCCLTSVPGLVTQQHLHLLVLLQRLHQDVALLVEQEEERQGDVIRVAAVPGHLKQRGSVAAAALVVVWEEEEEARRAARTMGQAVKEWRLTDQ